MMDERKTKEVLDFILSAYRARLAIQDASDNCPFDFKAYLTAWKRSSTSWDQLKLVIRDNLGLLLHEGVFDSILPYLVQSFPGAKKAGLLSSSSTANIKESPGEDHVCASSKSPAHPNIHGTIAELTLSSKRRERRISSKEKGVKGDKDEDCDIVIHVCDEMKGIKEDFHCRQSILTKEMGYFSNVTVKGQKLRDMDISVHCDITVFDWLMKWIHHRDNASLANPTLESTNVIGLAVSADFLQMSELVSECLRFAAANIEKVILYSPNLGCLSEGLVSKLAALMNNVDIEKRVVPVDRNDRITSRLYIQMILSLNDGEPDMSRGHYASTATLFKCNFCDQHLTNDCAPKSPCTSMRFDFRGMLYASHTIDPSWSLANFIKDLKKELKTWRKVYWRLWGTVHFFYCSSCQLYFPAKYIQTCRYHPESNRAMRFDEDTGTNRDDHTHSLRRSLAELERNIAAGLLKQPDDIASSDPSLPSSPFGALTCCQELAFNYTPFPYIKGCQLKDHIINDCDANDPNLATVMEFRDLVMDPHPVLARFDWEGIIQLAGERPSTVASLTPTEDKFLPPSSVPMPIDLVTTTESESSGSETGDEEEDRIKPSVSSARKKASTLAEAQGKNWESWVWNNELSTRYNQDMQREREEKLMMDLACLLSQRVPLDPVMGYNTSRYNYLNRRICKEHAGGSYVRIDQNWREQHQLVLTKGHKSRTAKN